MGRRERIYRHYLSAYNRFKTTERTEVTTELRNPHSLRELAVNAHMIITPADGAGGSERLLVSDVIIEREKRKFLLAGWARKAGLVSVPAMGD